MMVCEKCGCETEKGQEFCLNCANIDKASSKKLKLKKLVRLFIIAIFLLIVGRAFFSWANSQMLFERKENKLKHYTELCVNEEMVQKAKDLFNKEFAGTADENKGLSIIIQNCLDDDGSNFIYEDYRKRRINFFKNLNVSDKGKINDIVSKLESIGKFIPAEEIYANSEKYIGKNIGVIGFASDNDIKRKSIKVSYNKYSVEAMYSYYNATKNNNIDWDRRSLVFINAYIKQYSNSDDVYIIIYDISDWQQYAWKSWDLVDSNNQEAKNPIQLSIPSSYPTDIIPLYRSYGIVKTDDKDGNLIVTFETNATFNDAFKYYEDLLAKRGKYKKMPFDNKVDMLFAPIDDIKKSVSIIVNNGIEVNGVKSGKIAVTIMLQGGDLYEKSKKIY